MSNSAFDADCQERCHINYENRNQANITRLLTTESFYDGQSLILFCMQLIDQSQNGTFLCVFSRAFAERAMHLPNVLITKRHVTCS